MTTKSLGIHYLIDGFRLIAKPGLKRFVVMPLMINILVFVGLFFAFRYEVIRFNAWFDHFLPAWLHWLNAIVWMLFLASFAFVMLYTFVTIANILSAPFNSFLAEKVEFYLTGSVPQSRTLWENIKDIPRILGRQLSIIAYYVPRALFILILFFIPMVQLAAPFIWFYFNATAMSLTYFDYPTDNHRIPIQTVRDWLQQRQLLSFSFGGSVLIFSMIPILNFFIVAAAVAGATACWVEEAKS